MYAIKHLSDNQLRLTIEAACNLPNIILNIYGAWLRIASNDKGLIERVNEGYSFFKCDAGANSFSAFQLIALSSDNEQYRAILTKILDTDSLPPYCIIAVQYGNIYCINSYEALNYLTGVFFTAEMIARVNEEYAVIHGAGISNNGKGVIFPAALRSGKTTLALSFIYQGFQMSSDDVLVINRSTMKVHPYPRLLGIRQESLSLVPGMHREFKKMKPSSVFGETRWFLDKTDAVSEPFECVCVAFPRLSRE